MGSGVATCQVLSELVSAAEEDMPQDSASTDAIRVMARG